MYPISLGACAWHWCIVVIVAFSAPLSAADAVTVLPNGDVGIGVELPAHRLDVGGDVQADRVHLLNSSGGDATHRIDAAADTLFVVATPGATADAGIVLRTGEAGGGAVDRVTVAPNGNVGLGVDVPAARLHVSGDGVFSRDIYVDKTYLANSGGGDASHRLDGFEDKLFVVAEPGVTSGAGIVLRTGEAGGVALDRLTVTPDGQFGFGIQSPLARLHVNGGGIFTSNVELDKLILANSTGGDAVHRVDGYADTLYVVASPGQTSDGSIVLRTGEAGGLERDRVTVAPNGRVGLGIGSAGALAQLTVAVEGTTAGTAGVQANGVLITRNTSCGLNLHTPSDRQGQINFGDPENRKAGAIIYDHADDSLTLESTGILRLKAPVEATGSVGLLQDLTVGGEFTLGDGPSIAAISADPEMNTPNDQTLPTQAAVKSYVDSALSSGVVHVDARTAAGQVIQSTSTRINFDEVYRDTHEAVTTGGGWSFVAPLSGLYVVHLGIHPNSSSMAVDLWTNGAANRRIAQSNGTYMVVGSCEIHMNAGDTLAIEGFASSQTSLVGSGFYNWITITGRP